MQTNGDELHNIFLFLLVSVYFQDGISTFSNILLFNFLLTNEYNNKDEKFNINEMKVLQI